MAIRSTVVGSYPKPPDEGGTFVLRKTLHGIERGEATEDDLRKAHEDLARSVIAEQEGAGIDLITDGHVRWDDILTPFARRIEGFQIGGLLRWFDNNVYYRRPVCVGPLAWSRPCSVEAYEFASSVASTPVKAVVPGPITFARLSVDEHYGDHERFVHALAQVMAREAAALAAAGARHLQIDEPALLDAPEDLGLARSVLGEITQSLDGVETTLATYFGDAKRLGAELFELPVDVFALDFVSGPANTELLSDFPQDKTLQAGIVDARNTKLESIHELEARIGEITRSVSAGRVRLSPSAGLEYLPREKARAKLHRLAEAAQKEGN